MDLVPLTPQDQPRFTDMVRAYLAEIAPDLPLPTADRIAHAWKDPAREVLLIRAGDDTAGFVLIRTLPDGTHEISEFYVSPAARRSGLGTRAARAALLRYPGRWQLGFAKGADNARDFWLHVLGPMARAHRGPPFTPHQSGSLHFTIKESAP